MAQARPLLIGAVLLALALPGHPLAPLSGVPLDLSAVCLLLAVVGWWIALPGTPPRSGLLVGALVGLAALKALVGWAAPAYGLAATYRPAPAATAGTAAAPGSQRVDLALDFRGDTFPVHFFNDVRWFNFYTPNQPKRDLLPFEASWRGLLVVPTDGQRTLTLAANGPAELRVGSQTVTIDRPGRVREATLTAELPAGLVPISVGYARPDEAMPWLAVRLGPAGGEGAALSAPLLVRDGTSAEAIARDAWLWPLAQAIDAALVGLLVAAFLGHLWAAVRRTSRPSFGPAERALLAIYFVVAAGWELVGHLHLLGRAVILSGGNDWLAYESFARDVLINGPLVTEGRALGQGVPFYYQPLYIYWVALTHLVFGESLFAPLFLNAVLGVIAALGLYLLTRELFGWAAAVAALLLFELYRLTVFAPTAGLLLSENVLIPLVPVLLLVLVRLATTGRIATAAGAGFALGLAGLARTTPLALLPVALLILTVAWRRLGLGWRGIVARLALIVAVCVVTVGLATARNYVVSGRPVPITSSAGANLWEAHRPTARVDLSRVDRDPLYERLGLDHQTREVVEFARQDPAGYAATLVPMFLYAVGIVGAVDGRWDLHPGLFGLWLAYLLVTVLLRRARALPTWPLHAFIWSHLAQMTIFFSHQYGFRLILPMYVAMVPIAALGLIAALTRLAGLLAPFRPRLAAGAPLPPAAGASLVVVAVVGGAAGLGAGEWRGQQAAREAFYGLQADVALAARQASRPDLARRADSTYFVGDDSRSTEVAYLSGLAFPTLRWFDGARGLVLPPAGEEALYVVPDRAAADFAKRCLGEGASIGRERDPSTGAGLELLIASAGGGACAAPREPIGATFAESVGQTARLVGLDGPASIEPGRPLDVLILWDALDRPRNRARPFVRLVDSQGRRWGQAETAAYPSSSWRIDERAIGLARLELDPTLSPGEYRLEGGFSAGSGQERLIEDGPWGSAGLAQARGPTVRLVSRSTPLSVDGLPLDRRLDADLDGVRLLGVDVDRETARAGERLRLDLFWQTSGGRPEPRQVSLVLRRPGGEALHEWHRAPVDGTYPLTAWRPGEVVRDAWDLVLPPTLPAGELELAGGLTSGPGPAARYVPLGTLTVQAADRELRQPELRTPIGARFVSGVELVGLDYRGRRLKPGDSADLTLLWRAGGPVAHDQVVTVAVLDDAGRVLAQQESEPAGGKRPTSGWTEDELVVDGWRVRVPRDLPPGRVRLAVSLVDPIANSRVPTDAGTPWVELPIEVGSE
jgi:4-amino-4-deoxy-L-arabinose transferase-like glycosyltransferase